MNPLLSHLQPYPFERLRQLFGPNQPSPATNSPTSTDATQLEFAL